jgi:hypothetical protein
MRPGNNDSSDDDEDEDEEEMKALRAARRNQKSDGPPDLGEDAFVPRQQVGPRGPSKTHVTEELDDAEEAAVNDDLRLSFPMGFGKSKNVQSLEQVHASTRRQVAPDLQAMVREAEAASKGLNLASDEPMVHDSSSSIRKRNDESESGSEDDSDDDAPKKISDCVPCSHEAIMKVLNSSE